MRMPALYISLNPYIKRSARARIPSAMDPINCDTQDYEALPYDQTEETYEQTGEGNLSDMEYIKAENPELYNKLGAEAMMDDFGSTYVGNLYIVSYEGYIPSIEEAERLSAGLAHLRALREEEGGVAPPVVAIGGGSSTAPTSTVIDKNKSPAGKVADILRRKTKKFAKKKVEGRSKRNEYKVTDTSDAEGGYEDDRLLPQEGRSYTSEDKREERGYS